MSATKTPIVYTPSEATVLRVLTAALEQQKRDYHTGKNGATYDTLRAAAERVLRWRYAVEARCTGKTPKTVTAMAVSNLIR